MPKIKKSWVITAIIVVLIAGYFISKPFFKNPADQYIIEKISSGDVVLEISETGSVRATENLNLGFKAAGKIARINVAVGSDVKRGQALAELDSGQLAAQLQSARAALVSAEQQYNKVVNGSTPQDIKTYQDAVDSAKHDLQSSYNGAANTLSDAYIKMYNAYIEASSAMSDYFTAYDQPGIRVSQAVQGIKQNMQEAGVFLDKVKSAGRADADIDSAISQFLSGLGQIADDLKIIREQCDEGSYYFSVPSADKTSIDTQKTSINTALTNVTASQTSINSDKSDLQEAEGDLAAETASARPEDIGYYKSQIDQAKANADMYSSQLNDNYLRSPMDGKVTAVNVKTGQVVSASQSVINLLSAEPFQIKVNIYEQDIVDVKTGDSVKINLVAFPRQTFEGKVLSINPAETIVDNVVYYEVTVEFLNQPEGVKSGMTADIIIEADKKENVLRAPKNAVQNMDGKDTVQIIKGGKIENRDIVVGLEGNDYYEVVLGLSEGDEIIIGRK